MCSISIAELLEVAWYLDSLEAELEGWKSGAVALSVLVLSAWGAMMTSCLDDFCNNLNCGGRWWVLVARGSLSTSLAEDRTIAKLGIGRIERRADLLE